MDLYLNSSTMHMSVREVHNQHKLILLGVNFNITLQVDSK